MEKPSVIVFFGRPGSGKGTQMALLAQRLGWKTLSSGDRFRALREEKSALGDRVRETYDAGKLLPDWFADYLLEDALLALPAADGIILDGFGRSAKQAAHLDEILAWLGRPYEVIHLAVSEEETERRMLGRAGTDARPDSDTIEKVRERSRTYAEQTAPAIEVFRERGRLIEIDGEKTPDEIAAAITAALSL